MEQELEKQEEDIWIKTFSSTPPFKNIEITNYFNYKSRFNGVFSRNNLPRIKDGANVISLDEKHSKGTYCVSLFIDRNVVVYFDSFGIECIPQAVLSKFRDNLTTHNIFRIQYDESVDFIFSLS